MLEKRQGVKIACLEEIAYRSGWISEEKLREVAEPMLRNQYGQYLLKLLAEVARDGRVNGKRTLISDTTRKPSPSRTHMP